MSDDYKRTLVRCTSASLCMTYNGMALGLSLGFKVEPHGEIFWTTPCLDTYSEEKKRRIGTAYGFDFLLQFFEALKIENLKDLIGKHFYVLSADEIGWGTSSDKWLGFEQLGLDGDGRIVFADVAAEWALS